MNPAVESSASGSTCRRTLACDDGPSESSVMVIVGANVGASSCRTLRMTRDMIDGEDGSSVVELASVRLAAFVTGLDSEGVAISGIRGLEMLLCESTLGPEAMFELVPRLDGAFLVESKYWETLLLIPVGGAVATVKPVPIALMPGVDAVTADSSRLEGVVKLLATEVMLTVKLSKVALFAGYDVVVTVETTFEEGLHLLFASELVPTVEYVTVSLNNGPNGVPKGDPGREPSPLLWEELFPNLLVSAVTAPGDGISTILDSPLCTVRGLDDDVWNVVGKFVAVSLSETLVPEGRPVEAEALLSRGAVTGPVSEVGERGLVAPDSPLRGVDDQGKSIEVSVALLVETGNGTELDIAEVSLFEADISLPELMAGPVLESGVSGKIPVEVDIPLREEANTGSVMVDTSALDSAPVEPKGFIVLGKLLSRVDSGGRSVSLLNRPDMLPSPSDCLGVRARLLRLSADDRSGDGSKLMGGAEKVTKDVVPSGRPWDGKGDCDSRDTVIVVIYV